MLILSFNDIFRQSDAAACFADKDMKSFASWAEKSGQFKPMLDKEKEAQVMLCARSDIQYHESAGKQVNDTK